MNIKIKFIVLIVLVSVAFPVKAQMATADVNTHAILTNQIFLNSKIASEEAVRSKAQFLEFLNQFAQIIKTVQFVSSTIRNVYDLGKTIATTNPKEWLDAAVAGVESSLPVIKEIREDVEDIIGQGKAISKGTYFDYVSRWDKKTLNFYNKLLLNYEKHAMFPELYPLSSKARGWEKETHAMIIKRAWTESGMANEMDDDMVRRRLFGQYYQEFMKQAQENNNLEAMGMAKQIQASYLINEGIDHLRKNSDMEVVRYMSDQEKMQRYEVQQKEYNKKMEALEEKATTVK